MTYPDPDIQRIFLVGTARAGTTLLQGMLGSHPSIYTLPETHFWDKSMPKQPFLRFFKVLGEKDRIRTRQFLDSLGAADLANLLPGGLVHSKRRWTEALLSILDQLASRNGKTVWLEKTPLHLYYIDILRATDPGIQFLHILRDPIDNIASLLDAGIRHGDAFRQGSLEKATERWIKEYAIQKALIGKPGHHFVRYEELVDHPELILRKALEFLALTWNPAVLGFQDTARHVSTVQESWKDRNTGELVRSGKAAKVLTPEQADWIERSTIQYPTTIFNV